MSKKSKTPESTKITTVSFFKKNEIYISLSLLLIFIIIAFIVQLNFINRINRLPAPLFGGDHFFQKGVIEHLRGGGRFMDASSLVSAMPAYLPAYGWCVATFANLFNLETVKAMFVFSLILLILSYLLWFIFFKIVFKNSYVSLFGAVIVNSLVEYYSVIILKYTEFARYIIVPIFLIFLYLFLKDKKCWNALLLGLSYGVLSFTHSVGFMGATLILIFVFFWELFENLKNKIKLKEYFKKIFVFWIIFAIVGGLLSLVYWYKPIFIHQLDMSGYDRGHMDTPDFHRFDVGLNFILNNIKNFFFNFSEYRTIILSILAILGIFLFFKIKEESTELRYTKIVLFATIFATLSFIITEPLFKINIVPTYVVLIYTSIGFILLGAFGINYLLKKYSHNTMALILIIILIVSIFINGQIKKQEYYETDKWMLSVAKSDMYPEYISLDKFLRENTTVSDVLLTAKELGFAVNSFNGIKLVTGRWAMNGDPYTNLPQRDTDVAIIFYGKNTENKKELIKKYNAKYLYWDYRWISQEFYFDDKGNLLDYSDPLMTLNKEEYQKQLNDNEIKYIEHTGKIDPTVSSDEYRKFDILIISPENYRSAEKPWNENLDPYLEEIWSYKQDGQKIAILYKINVK